MIADTPNTTQADDATRRNRLLAGVRMLFSLRADKSLARIGVMSLAFAAMFSAIGVRLVMMGAGADGRPLMPRSTASMSIPRWWCIARSRTAYSCTGSPGCGMKTRACSWRRPGASTGERAALL